MQIRDRIKGLRRVPARDLKPHPRNWRTHPKAQREALQGVLAEIGYADALIARETEDGSLELVDGHLRAETTPDMEVPVLVLDVSREEADKLLVSLDPLAALAGRNDENLAALLATIETDNDALAAMFADLMPPVVNEGRCDPDEIPEPPDEPTTKPGDLWLLGDHRLLCGDSAKPGDVDRLLDGAKVHLVNTDPPYNVKVEPRSNNAIAAGLSSFTQTHHQGLDVARHPSKAKGTTRKMRAKDRPLENDFVSDEAFDGMLHAWFGNIARVLLPGRSFYIWGGYANCGNYPPVLKAHDLYFSQSIIWNKLHPVLTRKDFMGAHEWAFYGWKLGAGHRFFGPPNVPDLWEVKKVNPTAMQHLCLHPDTEVLTDAGFRPVRSIGEGDRVFAGDGKFRAVTHVSSHRYASSRLYRITAKGGNAATVASDNHPFLVWRPRRRGAGFDGGEVVWVRADDMRRGDYTMTPFLSPEGPDPHPEIDEEEWFLFGLYLAQGHLQDAGHGDRIYPTFSINKKRQDLAARICARWPGAREYDPNDYSDKPTSGLVVMAFDGEAGRRFEALGGRLSHGKRLAPEVFALPAAKRRAVFMGWVNGDGCKVAGRDYLQGSTVSADLAAHLALLAESVGYRAAVYAYDPPADLGSFQGRPFKSRRRVYNLYFYERRQLAKRGAPTLIEHEGLTYKLRPVKSVEPVPYEGDVWNLSVEGEPSFQTRVGLSHNTEKPVDLATRAIEYSSRTGENVLDLFGGSGSTLVGAEMTGRKAFLMEIDCAYADVIVQRFAKFTGGKAERVRATAG